MEKRNWQVPLEIRARDDDKQTTTIGGYAAVFNSVSADLGGFYEVVAPGAFARSIAQNDVRALWDHDPKYVLGRTAAGTLALAEDDRGLRIEALPPDTTWANDLLTMVRRGDVNQMSFGFYVRDEEWGKTEDGAPLRTLKDVDLFDVSVVAYPAYEATEVSAEARSKAQALAQAGDSDEARQARTRARRAARQRAIEILGEMR